MEEILAKVRAYEEINLKNDEDKKEKMEKEENIAKDVRKKCMETYSESLKRKKLLINFFITTLLFFTQKPKHRSCSIQKVS